MTDKELSHSAVADVEAHDETDDEPSKEDIAKVQKWQNKKNGFRKFSDNKDNKPKSNQNKSQGKEGKPFCLFCHKNGHIQEDCYSRKNANKPCISARGKTYWPKGENTNSTVSLVDPSKSGFH